MFLVYHLCLGMWAVGDLLDFCIVRADTLLLEELIPPPGIIVRFCQFVSVCVCVCVYSNYIF
jgi:hypothetical protein